MEPSEPIQGDLTVIAREKLMGSRTQTDRLLHDYSEEASAEVRANLHPNV